MIKANELRIGNWVKCEKHIVSVTSIIDYPNKKVVGVHGHTLSAALPFDEYEPIPLIPEILLACGFRHQIEDDVSYYIQENIWICHSGEDWYLADRIDNKPFHSLHQLQNLIFALTGTELEYKPEKQIQ